MMRFVLICGFLALSLSVVRAQTPLILPIAPGPFRPTMDSLKEYECPQWFKDAKFGIWAHWGPQAVPIDGDWYARGMYEQGSGHNKYHLANYGHPSVFGYKDIIPLWKAEKWDPDRLMKLYKAAGAKYFVSMGTHHDNFFLWKSDLHKWNAVNMGPHRDVVGDWQKAAKQNGLYFGVSEHLGASFTWFQSSHRSDKTGPKAGVPYDGADPKYADLYHFPALPGDTGWYSKDPRWQQQWFNEIKELVDNYHPDLLYSDGAVPFGNEVGRSMIAHLYNDSASRHGGVPQVIYNCKQPSEGRWVEDLERGIMPRIDPFPWQTDTSIGDWFYNRNWKFRPIKWVVHTLVDNVSKNGNLLLNVVQRPDGSLDPEVETLLEQMAKWTAVHGEAIYGSRPWRIYGEGNVKAKGGSFKEDFTYSSSDIRFTTQGASLYALALGWPENGELRIRSLARPEGSAQNEITSIKLLGYPGKITWTQTPDALIVRLPKAHISELTVGLKINGTDLRPVLLPEPKRFITPNAAGTLDLVAEGADMHGDQIKTEERGGSTNIGFWDRGSEFASWNVTGPAQKYRVTANIATQNGGSEFVFAIGDRSLTGKSTATGSWDNYVIVDLGVIELTTTAEQVATIKPRDPAAWKPINLRWIKLTPVR